MTPIRYNVPYNQAYRYCSPLLPLTVSAPEYTLRVYTAYQTPYARILPQTIVGAYTTDITIIVPYLRRRFKCNHSIAASSPLLLRLLQHSSSITLHLAVQLDALRIIFRHLSVPLTQPEIMYYVLHKPRIAMDLLESCEYLELEYLMQLILTVMKYKMDKSTMYLYVQVMQQNHNNLRHRRWIHILEEELITNFVTVLPFEVGGSLEKLKQVYAKLPLYFMVRVLQHAELPVRDPSERERFVKECMAIHHPHVKPVLRFDMGVCTITVGYEFFPKIK